MASNHHSMQAGPQWWMPVMQRLALCQPHCSRSGVLMMGNSPHPDAFVARIAERRPGESGWPC